MKFPSMLYDMKLIETKESLIKETYKCLEKFILYQSLYCCESKISLEWTSYNVIPPFVVSTSNNAYEEGWIDKTD